MLPIAPPSGREQTASADRWWDDSAAVARYVGDLLAAELANLHPGRTLAAAPWAPSLRLDEDGLGADSLDRLKLGTALGEAIHLTRSGLGESLLAQATVGDWVATATRSLGAHSAELTFRTSGSTGRPKWCVHRACDLSAEIDIHAERFAACKRIVSAVPSHHIYGFLFTVLLAVRLGVEVVDVRTSVPAAVSGRLRNGDLVIGQPEFWAAFIRGATPVAPGVSGVTSTAPCPPHVARAVRSSGVEALVEVYGSSETGGVGARENVQDAFTLFPYWRRGLEPRSLVRVGSDGSETTVAVPDLLEWEDARRMRPIGRAEGAVQVGGTNVFPERVRAVLVEHPAVSDAAVRLMDPSEGERLKAFVVPRAPDADPAVLRAALWTFIERRLTVPERPRALDFGAALPRGANGKLTDWPLSRDRAT